MTGPSGTIGRKRTPAGPGSSPERVADQRALAQVELIADVLDRAIRIPGTNMRVGIDPLLGLIPGVGDVIGAGVSGYTMLLAARLGAPKSVLVRMLANVAIDSAIGAIPAVGDLFDFAWKSNSKNVDLLREHVGRPVEARKTSMGFLALMLLLLVLLLIGAVWAAVQVVQFLASVTIGG